MKKLLFLSMLLFCICSFAQDPWNPTRVYCEIVGTGNLTGTKVKIEIDFGQAKKFWTGSNDKFLVDESGKEIKFNSMVDAMNYMAQFGWKFEQAYVLTENSTMSKQNVYHYLLSRELKEGEDVNSGIFTRKDYNEQNNENLEEQQEERKSDKSSKKKEKIADDIY